MFRRIRLSVVIAGVLCLSSATAQAKPQSTDAYKACTQAASGERGAVSVFSSSMSNIKFGDVLYYVPTDGMIVATSYVQNGIAVNTNVACVFETWPSGKLIVTNIALA
jgi:hypothetical protein